MLSCQAAELLFNKQIASALARARARARSLTLCLSFFAFLRLLLCCTAMAWVCAQRRQSIDSWLGLFSPLLL